MEQPDADACRWYVLHFIHKLGRPSPQKHIDDFNREGHSLRLFAPIIRPAHVVNGKVVYREKLLTYYYVFVRGTFDEVKALCMRPGNDLSFLLDRGSDKRYATISDADMENFRILARAYTNTVPFFNIEEVELSEGDLVEVVGGEYDGLKGTFLPKPRSNKGNLVIAVTAALGVVAWNIDAKCIRILEFARDTRRQYDYLDAFIPRLFPIMRKFHAKEEFDNKEKSLLNVFNLRMGVVTMSNHKAEAKLLATLMCVQYMIGDMAALRHTRERYEKRKAAITNFWTLALVQLMFGVVMGDASLLQDAYDKLPTSTDTLTNTQRQLIEEYQYYIQDSQPAENLEG